MLRLLRSFLLDSTCISEHMANKTSLLTHVFIVYHQVAHLSPCTPECPLNLQGKALPRGTLHSLFSPSMETSI
jgi:hypothetical protein